MNKKKEVPSDLLELSPQENNAIFISARNVPRVPMEFHHLYMTILMRDPTELGAAYRKRAHQFYDYSNSEDTEPNYFPNSNSTDETIWATTISGTSECAYAPETVQDLGRLLSVPNYDRIKHNVTGKVVYTKKIALDNIELIRKALDFETNYNNDQFWLQFKLFFSGCNRTYEYCRSSHYS